MTVIVKPVGASVISDNIEGSVVVINLLNGRYYSMSGASSVLWDLVHTDEGLIFEPDTNPGIETFLFSLASEGLVMVGIAKPGDVPSGIQEFGIDSNDLGYQSFTDLEELLALDPIHDVDLSTGWPNQL